MTKKERINGPFFYDMYTCFFYVTNNIFFMFRTVNLDHIIIINK